MHEPHAGARRASHILIAAAALLVVLAYSQVRSSMGHEAKRPGASANEHFGNGVVVRGDGVGYYAWLRSPLVDGDWQFDNEFDELNASRSWVTTTRTPTGARANPWSVGPACVWAVAVVPCHLLVSSGAFGPFAADGYSLPYQLAVAGAGLAGGLVALRLMLLIGRQFADPVAAAAGAACVALGSTFAYYAAVEPSLGHGLGATALLLFVWYWLRDFGALSFRRWAVLGALLGVSAIMRWQLAAYGIVLLGELAWVVCAGRPRPAVATLARAGAALAVGLLIGVLPQVAAWKVVFGSWLVEPMPLARNWFSPNLGRVLLSTDRGFFYWTPITLLAAVGMVIAVVRGKSVRRVQAGLLLLAVGAQVYALAVISGPGVYLGASFGYRQLTESAVLLAPGLAALFALRRKWTAGVVLLSCALVGWNLLLVGAHRYGQLPELATPGELARGAGWYVSDRLPRRELILIGIAACALFVLVLRARWRPPAAQSVVPIAARRAA